MNRLFLRSERKSSNPVWWLSQVAKSLRWGSAAELLASREQLHRLLQALCGQGVKIPPPALETLIECGALSEGARELAAIPLRRIVGLAAGDAEGYVVPLEVKVAPRWKIQPSLPLSIGRLHNALMQLMAAFDAPQGQALPERLSFSIQSPLSEWVYGESMDVAGLLAMIDAAGGRKLEIFSRCCALLQPDGSGGLLPVKEPTKKLAAFVREFGGGSLLVRAKGCAESAAFDRRFTDVWSVESFAELVGKLQPIGALDALLEQTPVDRHEFANVVERLRSLIEEREAYATTLELAQRLVRTPHSEQIPSRLALRARGILGDVYRHSGRSRSAEENARATLSLVESAGDDSTFDAQYESIADVSASYYDSHRFEEMAELLAEPSRRIIEEPRLVEPLTRVKVLNTLGRALVILGRPGWTELFARTMKLQETTDRSNVSRTRNYLIHGFVRHDRLDEAQRELNQNDPADANGMSLWFIGHLRAELARRRGQTWLDPRLEAQLDGSQAAGHACGFYLQATARQPGHDRDWSVERFQRAFESFAAGVDQASDENILVFLSQAMRLAAAAWAGDASIWRSALDRIRGFVASAVNSGLLHYYAEEVQAVPPAPDRNWIDRLLVKIPYF